MMEKELPKGWVEIKLGEILKLRNGYAFNSKDYQGNGIPVIRISDIQDGLVIIKNAVRVSEKLYNKDYLIEEGDILIAMSGATTGKYGIYNEKDIALQNQRVGNLKPFAEDLLCKKLFYYLLGALKKEIEDKAYGGAQPNISSSLIEEMNTVLPPLAEQHRIVAKLDAAFAHIDTVKAKLERIPELLKNFRQAVLTQAVTGKLTEEWREENKGLNAKDLLDLLQLQHSQNGGHKKGNASSPTEGVHDLSSENIPKTWVVAELKDLCNPNRPITYGILKPGPEIMDGIPYIRVADFPNDSLKLKDIKRTSQEIDQQFKRSKLEKGDLLLSIRGTVGRIIEIPEGLEGANITQRCL